MVLLTTKAVSVKFTSLVEFLLEALRGKTIPPEYFWKNGRGED